MRSGEIPCSPSAAGPWTAVTDASRRGLAYSRQVLSRTRGARAVVALALIAASLATSGLLASAASSAPSRDVVKALPTLDRGLVGAINRARTARGLVPLRFSASLRAAATAHSRDMVRHGYFSHDSFDGTPADQRLGRYYSSFGYRLWQIGEALLWWSPDVDASRAVQAWLASPEHRAILLSPGFREVGVSALHATAAGGDFQGTTVTLITADFGVRTR
jgi:uncharacterized protein YkwD